MSNEGMFYSIVVVVLWTSSHLTVMCRVYGGSTDDNTAPLSPFPLVTDTSKQQRMDLRISSWVLKQEGEGEKKRAHFLAIQSLMTAPSQGNVSPLEIEG